MRLKLLITTNVDGDVFELVLKKSKYRIGRRFDNDLRIKETYISAYHSEIRLDSEGNYTLVDCGSSNGTFLNGIRVEEPTTISPGDYIKFGILKVKVAEHTDTMPKVVALSERGSVGKKKSTPREAIASFSTSEQSSGNTGPVEKSGATGLVKTSGTTGPLSGSTDNTQLISLQQKVSQLEQARDQAREEAAELRHSASKLKKELENESKIRAELAREIDSKTRLVSTVTAKVEKLGAKLDSKERKGSENDQKKLKELNERIALLETELKVEKDKASTMPLKIEGYTSAINKADLEIENLKKLSEERKTAEEKALAEAESLKKALSEEKSSAAVLSKDLKAEAAKITELEKQLKQTESAKAAEAKESAAKLTAKLTALQATLDTERDDFQSKLSALEKDLKEAQTGSKSAAKEQSTLSKKLSALEASLEKESATSKELSSELSEKESLLKAATADLKKAEKELSSKGDSVSALEARESKIESELKTLKEELAAKDSKIADLESGVKSTSEELHSKLKENDTVLAKIKEELESANEELSARTKVLSEKESLLATVTADLDKAEKKLSSTGDSLSTLEARESKIESELKALKEEISAKDSKIAELESGAKSTSEELSAKLKENETALEKIRKELDSANEKLTAKASALSEKDSKLENTSVELDELRSELKSAQKTISDLTDREEAAEQSGEELRKKLEKTEKDLCRNAEMISKLESELEEAAIEKKKAVILQKEVDEKTRLFEGEISKVADLEAQLESKEDELRGVQASIEGKVDAEVAKLGKELKELRSENSKLSGNLEDTAKQLSDTESEKESLLGKLEKESAAAVAAAALVSSLQSEKDNFESAKVEEEKELRVKAEKRITELEAILRKEENAVKVEQSKATRLESTLEEKVDEIKVLKSNLSEVKSENASLTRNIETSEADHSKLALENMENRRKIEDDSKLIASLKDQVSSEQARVAEEESQRIDELKTEIEGLHQLLDQERSVSCDLAFSLDLTRAGMSEVLRRAWHERDEQKAILQLEENIKLSEVEKSLGEAIAGREELSAEKHRLEDRMTKKEEKLEKLLERIDDLESELEDSRKGQEEILRKLDITREGMSSVLHNTRNQVSDTRTSFVLEKKSREEAENLIAKKKEEIAELIENQAKRESAFERELEKWKLRLEDARSERSEHEKNSEELKTLQEAIETSAAKKLEMEAEVEKLSKGMAEFRIQHDQLKIEKEKILADRNEMKSGLGVARSELNMVQKRCRETLSQEERLTQSIQAAEKRVEALKHLEGQLENAVERKRQENGLSRKDVFSENHRNQVVGPVNGNEEILCRKLINKLDLIDDLSAKFDKKWRYPKVAEQLQILKGSFLELLKEFSVNQFNLEPGTVLSLEERKRIKLVPTHEVNPRKAYYLNGKNGTGTGGGGKSQVVETLRPGYIYRNGTKDVIIRKAEVIVG